MIMKSPTTKPYILLAKEAPIAILIAKKGSKKYHIIKWNLETDEFEYGSWFHGTIYNLKTDLSFDGKYMVYFAMGDGHSMRSNLYCWTAICEPPFLKAKILYDHLDTWHGGGIFWGDDGKQLFLEAFNHPLARKQSENKITDDEFTKKYIIKTTVEEYPFPQWKFSWIFYYRLLRNGWKDVSTGQTKYDFLDNRSETRDALEFEKIILNYKLRMKLKFDWIKHGMYHLCDYFLFDDKNNLINIIDNTVIWADVDVFGRLIFVKNGIVYRCEKDNLFNFSPIIDCNILQPPTSQK